LGHWTDNVATEGILLSTRDYHQEGKTPMELTCMDFAGHEEFDS
jgi:GTPase SAR1 family protein